MKIPAKAARAMERAERQTAQSEAALADAIEQARSDLGIAEAWEQLPPRRRSALVLVAGDRLLKGASHGNVPGCHCAACKAGRVATGAAESMANDADDRDGKALDEAMDRLGRG